MDRAVPAAGGLADVVRGAGQLSSESVVRQVRGQAAGGFAGCGRVTGKESVSGSSAEVRSRDGLRLHVHQLGRARMVEAVAVGDVSARGGLQGEVACKPRTRK